MVYKFKSPATADLIMLAASGDQLLRLLGREPSAQGIIQVIDMPAALQTLHAAIEAAEARLAAAKVPTDGGSASTDTEADAEADSGAEPAQAVGLRQRLWPMVEMIKRAHAANAPVVWGV